MERKNLDKMTLEELAEVLEKYTDSPAWVLGVAFELKRRNSEIAQIQRLCYHK